MASCWILVGLVLVALAFISSAISFVVPYWIPHGLVGNDEGLWGWCRSIDGTCTWAFQNDFQWLSERPREYCNCTLYSPQLLSTCMRRARYVWHESITLQNSTNIYTGLTWPFLI